MRRNKADKNTLDAKNNKPIWKQIQPNNVVFIGLTSVNQEKKLMQK
ncbi:hypothetical protein EV06_1571 [Prochlorococcus sp. MIT 0602]|nr:hypothetical protein EV06_1571 [Prochlorococcus sp. MIT 0602]KGG16061.1 hypothetical protein EV07_2029 [Prochlorococcus sp. MIT 0603]